MKSKYSETRFLKEDAQYYERFIRNVFNLKTLLVLVRNGSTLLDDILVERHTRRINKHDARRSILSCFALWDFICFLVNVGNSVVTSQFEASDWMTESRLPCQWELWSRQKFYPQWMIEIGLRNWRCGRGTCEGRQWLVGLCDSAC